MTLAPWEVLLLFAAPLALGAAVLRLAGLRFADDRFAYPAFAWGAGTLATALLIYFLMWAQAGLRGVKIVVPAVALIVLVVAFRRKAAPPETRPPSIGPRRFLPKALDRLVFTVFLLMALGTLLDRILETNTKIIFCSDEASIWASKAKCLAAAGGFNDTFRADAGHVEFVQHKDYPLYNPLLQVWTFAAAGEMTDVDNRLPMQMFSIATVLFLAGALARRVPGFIAGPIVFLHAASHIPNFLAATAYADHMTAFGFAMAGDAWLRFAENRRPAWRRLAVIALTITLWSKNEGLMLVGAAAGAGVLLLLFRRARLADFFDRKDAWWYLLPFGVMVLHTLTNRIYGFENDLLVGPDGRSLGELIAAQAKARGAIVGGYFGAALLVFWPFDALRLEPSAYHELRLSLYNALPTAFLLMLVLFPLRASRGALIGPVAAIAATLAGFFAIYLGSFQEIEWHLFTSATRVLYDVVPLATVLLGASLRSAFFEGDRLGLSTKES